MGTPVLTIDPLYDADLDGPMTAARFQADAEKGAAPKDGSKALGPLVLILLPIVLGAAIGWMVQKMLDLLWSQFMRGNPLAATTVRWLYVRPAIRHAEQAEGTMLSADERDELEEAAMNGLSAAASKLTMGDVRAMRVEARK